jgi:secreted PhoX family phosphatase
MTLLDRRTFLVRGAAGMASIAAVERLMARSALAAKGPDEAFGYGPPQRMADQRGRFVLALPAGFSYVTFGEIGSTMSDGNVTPLALDGMAAFAGPGGTVRLIRNHEDRNLPGAGSVGGEPAAKYDPTAGGGTSTLDYDPATRSLVRDFISLNGTTVNCAGGFGLGRRSWLTGEETMGGPAHTDPTKTFAQRHGYLFEVPRDRGPSQLERGVPLRAAGRVSHEAAAADQRTGIVYETEDPGSGRGAGFYRFIPNDPADLTAGGRLQILGIQGKPQYDAREGQTVGRKLPVRWIDVPEPDPEYVNDDDPRGTFNQGWGLGATKFNRLEGCWYDEDDGSTYFVSTSGGDEKNGDVNPDGFREGFGQVWEFRPHGRSGGLLILHYESPGGEALDSPDNMTVTPRGGLLLAEDDASSAYSATDTHPTAPGLTDVNRLVGITAAGESFVFAVNTYSGSELAGVCFSPDGATLFVNIFGDATGTPAQHAGEGMTCAITGPWGDGPL